MAWKLHAIEQMRGASEFDFHTAYDVASVSESFVARTSP